MASHASISPGSISVWLSQVCFLPLSDEFLLETLAKFKTWLNHSAMCDDHAFMSSCWAFYDLLPFFSLLLSFPLRYTGSFYGHGSSYYLPTVFGYPIVRLALAGDPSSVHSPRSPSPNRMHGLCYPQRDCVQSVGLCLHAIAIIPIIDAHTQPPRRGLLCRTMQRSIVNVRLLHQTLQICRPN